MSRKPALMTINKSLHHLYHNSGSWKNCLAGNPYVWIVSRGITCSSTTLRWEKLSDGCGSHHQLRWYHWHGPCRTRGAHQRGEALCHTSNHRFPISLLPPRHICRLMHFAFAVFLTLFSVYHTLLSPLTPSRLDLHDCKMYNVALLTTAYNAVLLQEEGCNIQASPEYWSQGSINGKRT